MDKFHEDVYTSKHTCTLYLSSIIVRNRTCWFYCVCGFFAKRFVATLKQAQMVNRTGNAMDASWIRFSLYVQAYFLMYGITGNPLYDVEETILYFFAIGISYLPLIGNKQGD